MLIGDSVEIVNFGWAEASRESKAWLPLISYSGGIYWHDTNESLIGASGVISEINSDGKVAVAGVGRWFYQNQIRVILGDKLNI